MSASSKIPEVLPLKAQAYTLIYRIHTNTRVSATSMKHTKLPQNIKVNMLIAKLSCTGIYDLRVCEDDEFKYKP